MRKNGRFEPNGPLTKFSVRFSYEQLLPQWIMDTAVSDACVSGDYLAISTHLNRESYIHSLKIDTTSLSVIYNQSIKVNGDITCLSLGSGFKVLAGIWENGRVYLGKASLQHAADCLEMTDLSQGMSLLTDLRMLAAAFQASVFPATQGFSF